MTIQLKSLSLGPWDPTEAPGPHSQPVPTHRLDASRTPHRGWGTGQLSCAGAMQGRRQTDAVTSPRAGGRAGTP